MMDPATAAGIGGSIAGFFGGIYGYIQQRKAKAATEQANSATEIAHRTASEEFARSQSELLASYQSMSNDWKNRYEIEHAELQKYREYVHDKNKKDQETMLRLTEENADLRARTDLTPIVEQLKQQARTNEELGATLGKLTQAVTILLDRISHLEAVGKAA